MFKHTYPRTFSFTNATKSDSKRLLAHCFNTAAAAATICGYSSLARITKPSTNIGIDKSLQQCTKK